MIMMMMIMTDCVLVSLIVRDTSPEVNEVKKNRRDVEDFILVNNRGRMSIPLISCLSNLLNRFQQDVHLPSQP